MFKQLSAVEGLRSFAGIYLLYLSGSLFKSLMKTTGFYQLILMGCILLFAGVGICLLIHVIKKIMSCNHSKEE